MKKPFFLGALVASTLLVGCLDESELESDPAETLDEVSSAIASGCSHTTFTWRTSANSRANGQGAVSCNATQSRISVDVTLKRNGTNVAVALNDRCFNTRSCSVRVSHPDPAGSQQWCTQSRAGTPIIDHTAPQHCVSF